MKKYTFPIVFILLLIGVIASFYVVWENTRPLTNESEVVEDTNPIVKTDDTEEDKPYVVELSDDADESALAAGALYQTIIYDDNQNISKHEVSVINAQTFNTTLLASIRDADRKSGLLQAEFFNDRIYYRMNTGTLGFVDIIKYETGEIELLGVTPETHLGNFYFAEDGMLYYFNGCTHISLECDFYSYDLTTGENTLLVESVHDMVTLGPGGISPLRIDGALIIMASRYGDAGVSLVTYYAYNIKDKSFEVLGEGSTPQCGGGDFFTEECTEEEDARQAAYDALVETYESNTEPVCNGLTYGYDEETYSKLQFTNQANELVGEFENAYYLDCVK